MNVTEMSQNGTQRFSIDLRGDLVDPIAAGDVARLAPVLADDVLFLFPGLRPVRGRPATMRMLRRIRRSFETVRSTPTLSFQAGPDWMIATCTVEGTLLGGADYGNEMIAMARLDRDGRIASLSAYFKSTDFVARPTAPAIADRAHRASA